MAADPPRTTAGAAPRSAAAPRPEQKWSIAKEGYKRPTVILAAVLLAAALLQTLIERLGGAQAPLAVRLGVLTTAGICLAGALAWRWSHAYAWLSSTYAAVVILVAVLGGTVIGTVILQAAPAPEFAARYGSLASLLHGLHCDDIFHSYAFRLLLAVLALTSVLTVVRRRKTMLRWRHFGLLLTHIAVVLVLIGGLVGSLRGGKGMVHLTVGGTGDAYVSQRPEDQGAKIQLPFTLRLDKFQLAQYAPQYKVYTYRRGADGAVEVIGSDTPRIGAVVGVPPPGSVVHVRVLRTFEHAQQVDEWAEAKGPGGQGPVARVHVLEGGKAIADGWLHETTQQTARDAAGHVEVLLAWNEPGADALQRLLGAVAAPEHVLRLPDGTRLPVELGATYKLPGGGSLEVQNYLADFTFDSASDRAASRSDMPLNPVLVVMVAAPGQPVHGGTRRFLFAREDMRKMMEGRGPASAQEMVYEHATPRPSAGHTVLILGQKAERITAAAGQVVERAPLRWGEPFTPWPGSTVRVVLDAPLRDGQHRKRWMENPQAPANPAVELEITHGDGTEETLMRFAATPEPIALSEDRILVYREKPDGIKNYKSTLTVLEHGRPMVTRQVEVNDPLAYKGYGLYQANYDPDNPSYSGIQVVDDPGLPWVLAGLWLMIYGVLHTVAWRKWTPWWERHSHPGRPRDAGDEPLKGPA